MFASDIGVATRIHRNHILTARHIHLVRILHIYIVLVNQRILNNLFFFDRHRGFILCNRQLLVLGQTFRFRVKSFVFIFVFVHSLRTKFFFLHRRLLSDMDRRRFCHKRACRLRRILCSEFHNRSHEQHQTGCCRYAYAPSAPQHLAMCGLFIGGQAVNQIGQLLLAAVVASGMLNGSEQFIEIEFFVSLFHIPLSFVSECCRLARAARIHFLRLSALLQLFPACLVRRSASV